MESSVVRKQHLWLYAILPVLVLNIGGILIYGVYYALASVQPHLVAPIPPGQLTFAVYLLTAAVVWSLGYSIIRTARHHKTPLMTLVAPQGLGALKWGPAIGIFLLMNLIFAAYVLFVRLLGTWPTFPGLELWQEVSLLLAFVLIEPFCEELIWRGYLIPRLLERRLKPWGAVLLAAGSFALLHGIFLPDKLVAVFLIGLTNGWYYLRQRNLVPLVIAHAVVNLWSFSFFFFLH